MCMGGNDGIMGDNGVVSGGGTGEVGEDMAGG